MVLYIGCYSLASNLTSPRLISIQLSLIARIQFSPTLIISSISTCPNLSTSHDMAPKPQLSLTAPSSHPLTQAHSCKYFISSPSLIPTALFLRRPSAPSRYQFRCTGCGETFPLPCFTVGRRLRPVCLECWRWMWRAGICWSCGEVIFRKTDAVGFAWCWWHWSCFSCLVCSVSVLLAKFLVGFDRAVSTTTSKLLRRHGTAT